MDTMPESFNEGVTQASKHCSPKVAQRSSPRRLTLRRSERLRSMNVQVEQHNISLEKLNPTGPGKRHRALTETRPWLTGTCSLLNQEKNMPSSGKNRKKCKSPRKVIPEDVGNSNAQAKDVNVNDLKVCTGEPSNMPKQICDVGARPVSCPIWRGSFSGCSENFGTVEGLAAHMSNKACKEVFGTARLLPALLQSQMIPRLDVWPQSFNSSAPTDNVIDLYIFPENKRSEGVFDNLLNHMTGQDLAMKAVVDDIVLLVFTSLQLPYQYWRTLGKYYIWAVFSGKNAFFPYPQNDHHSIGNIVRALSSNLANDVGGAIEDERNLFEDWNTHGSSHQVTTRKSDPTHIFPCSKSKMLIRSQIRTLAQEAVEEQPPTGRTVTEGFAEDRTCNFINDGFTEIRVLTDSIPHEADATERSVVENDPGSAATQVIDKEAPGDTAMIACAFPSAISKSVLHVPDVEEAITATHFHEVLPNFALQGHQEGEGAYSLDQVGIQSIGTSLDLPVASALNELIRGASEFKSAPTIADNKEDFSNSVLQECDGGQGAHSLDREDSQSIGPSVFHMASAFDEMSSDEVTPVDNSAERVGVYSVKQHLAPILRTIIDNHGDIARDCPLKCSKMLTSALERVCEAVHEFQTVHFKDLRNCHLKFLYSAIKDAEVVNLDVKWLHNRYNEVMETVQQIKQYKNMKVDRRKTTQVAESKKTALELKKTEMMKLQSDIQSLESEVALMAAKNESLNDVICSVKSKSKHFSNNSLADILL